jgi:hypothetical protein
MGKILKYEEINQKKNQHVEYSESYELKFWIQEDEFWKQKTETYFAKTKGEHVSVIDRWQNDYKGKNVKYVSVTYQ